jgi:hypothetical protein
MDPNGHIRSWLHCPLQKSAGTHFMGLREGRESEDREGSIASGNRKNLKRFSWYQDRNSAPQRYGLLHRIQSSVAKQHATFAVKTTGDST